MPEHSAGILMFRRTPAIAVLLIRPGGPFWRNRDVGAWQIPKGGIEPGETPIDAALREAEEELGSRLEGELLPLGDVRQSGGKCVTAFALEGEIDPARIVSNRFTLEWPPRSGRMHDYPEVEEARWFTIEDARDYMLKSQQPFLERLAEVVGKD